MTNQSENKLSLDLGDLLDKAKSHRVILSSPDGKPWINVSVLVAAILTLIMPQVVALIALVAVFKGATVEIVDTDTTKKKKREDRYEQV